MKTTTNVICLKCGNIGKSGKISCCGRGGSWFRNCGASGNTQLDHMWSEGIQACKTWVHSKTSFEQQLKQKIQSFSNGVSLPISTDTTAAKTLTFTSSNAPRPKSGTTQIIYPVDTPTAKMSAITAAHTPTSTSITTQGFEKLPSIVCCIILLLVTRIQC